MMIVPTSDTHSELGIRWPRGIEILWMPIIFPTSSGPEEGLVSYLVNHNKRLINYEKKQNRAMFLISTFI